MSRFAIHQPNYLPWIGFFIKMLHVDSFVYLDAVQFPRGRSVAARNKIKTSQGEQLLTVPISFPDNSDHIASYREVIPAGDKWSEKHLKALYLNYKKAPHFEEVIELLSPIKEEHASFASMTIAINERIANYLSIETKRYLLSELLPSFGQKNLLIGELGKKIGAKEYVSGSGATDYNDGNLLESHGLKLLYLKFELSAYEQLWGKFIPNLSMIDLLFNKGKSSIEILKDIEIQLIG